ncbi:MarR family winged helix-turn-helix transcriptional regulator [Priestia megaterium]
MKASFLLYLNLVNTSKIYKDQLNEVLNPYNISGPHFQAMVCIKEYGEKSLTELAETLLVEKPTATKILQKLVSMNYLQTTTGTDKRCKKIVFTEDGKRKFAGVLQAVENFRSELMVGFSEDEISIAITVLTEMQNRLKARNQASI